MNAALPLPRLIRNGVFFLLLAALVGFWQARGETKLQLGESTGSAGETVEVPLRLFLGEEASGAQVDLFADPAVAKIVSVSGSAAGPGHVVDSEDLGGGQMRVLVYSATNDALFSEALIDLELELAVAVVANERAVVVEAVTLANAEAQEVASRLVPHATFAGPNDAVVYQMGDEVSAVSVAYGTGTEVDRVVFLVNGRAVAADPEAPYEQAFVLEDYGEVELAAVAVDAEGNAFASSMGGYQVQYPSSLDAWLNVFFTPAEQADAEVGGLGADVDLDGRATLLEYALGLHPRDSEGLRGFGFDLEVEGEAFDFRFRRPVGVTDVKYVFEVSEDLFNWVTMDLGASGEVVALGDYIEEVRLRVLEAEDSRRFGRLKVEEVAP